MASEEESHALVADQEALIEFALMAKSSSKNEVFDNSLCSKACKKNTDSLNTKIVELSEKLSDSKTMLYHYKLGLSRVEARLVEFKNQEIKFCEKIRGLEFNVESKNNRIERLTNELEELKKEKEGLDSKLIGLPEFADDTITDYSRPSPSIESKSNNLQSSNSSVFKNGESSSSILSKHVITFVKAADSPTVIKTNKDETVRKSSVKYVKMYRKTSKSSNVMGNQRNWNNLKSQQLGENFLMKNKACFKCGHFDHLAYDCGVWVNQGKTWAKNNYTHKSRSPRTVFHKTGRTPMRTNRPNMNVAQPKRTSFAKPAHSYIRRTFQRTSAVRTQFRVPRVSTVNTKFPIVNKKYPTGNSKLSTANLGYKGKVVKASACWIWRPKQNTTDKGPNNNSVSVIFKKYQYIDTQGRLNGCSWHMTGNISYLSDYEPFNGGYVSFGQGGGKITGKGIIKTGKLKFENVYFMKDLKYNLFSVSQICDNKNSVIFNDSDCIVLGRDFKLKDDTNVLLKTPRQHNMYSIDLNNIVSHKDLTCLVAKASADECMLRHRRLVYQMDVKSTFLYGTIDEEVYLCREFKALMHDKFQMSVMGELNFFLSLQVQQKKVGIFLSQDKYVGDILKKLDIQMSDQLILPWTKRILGEKTELASRLAFYDYHNMIAILEKSKHNVDFHQIVDFVEASHIRYALTINLTVYVSHIRQFWSTARIETTDEGTKILAIVDGKLGTISKSSIRRNLKLNDEEGISTLPDAELFENLALMSLKSTGFNEFSSNIATVVGEGSGTPTEPHHTPSPEAQQSPNTALSSPSLPPATTKTILTSTRTAIPILRQYSRRARIAQSSALPTTVDELASPLGDDSQGEACLTVSGLEAGQDRANIIKTSTLPHDSTPKVTSLAADEGSMQQQIQEFTDLCTRLQRQHTEMATKIAAQDLEISHLKARITFLEDKDGGRAEPSGEDATIKGRSLETGEEAANILTSGVQVVSVPPAAEVSTVGIPTSSGLVPTASPIFTTASVVTPYSRRKGKEKMVESDTPKKKKLQEQIDVQVAREIEEQMAKEDQRRSEQIARDAEIARIHAEEELQMLIDGLDRNNEVIARHLHEYEQAAAELTIEEKIKLINKLVKYQDHHSKILKYQAQQSKPLSKKQQREFYMSMLKSHSGWKTKHFKEEVSQEDLKEMMQLVPVEEVYVEALQVKHPIIDWEIHFEGQRNYWKIIRLGGSTVVYQFFVDMLKHFDREDLI
nr:ribonuclease H-like domain-containing protein [Tanacetum cinerariifolium]